MVALLEGSFNKVRLLKVADPFITATDVTPIIYAVLFKKEREITEEESILSI